MSRLTQLEKLLAADPGDPFVLYGLAQEYAKAGSWLEAVAFYDRCLAADPNYYYAYFHKARALQAAGDMRGAAHAARAGVDRVRTPAESASPGGDNSKALSELSALLEELGA